MYSVFNFRNRECKINKEKQLCYYDSQTFHSVYKLWSLHEEKFLLQSKCRYVFKAVPDFLGREV